MHPGRLVVILLVLAGGAACVKTRAQTPAPPPSLLVPEPPDRVIVPAAALPDPVETPPPAPVPAPARPRDTPPARPADRPAPAATAPAIVTPPDTPAAPPQVLQTTTNTGELESRALTQIGAAERDLTRINVRQLSANGRTQYDAALGFVRQAKDALKIKNYLLARELADKAASLARELAR